MYHQDHVHFVPQNTGKRKGLPKKLPNFYQLVLYDDFTPFCRLLKIVILHLKSDPNCCPPSHASNQTICAISWSFGRLVFCREPGLSVSYKEFVEVSFWHYLPAFSIWIFSMNGGMEGRTLHSKYSSCKGEIPTYLECFCQWPSLKTDTLTLILTPAIKTACTRLLQVHTITVYYCTGMSFVDSSLAPARIAFSDFAGCSGPFTLGTTTAPA